MINMSLFGFSTPSLAATVSEKAVETGSVSRTERQELSRREKEIREAVTRAKSQLSGRHLTEDLAEAVQSRSAISDAVGLLADHEAIIPNLRVDCETAGEKYHDVGTNDFLTGLMGKHEKMAWMHRAFLEGKA